ncbi:hypothetical protein [Nonomuraea sp. NEAU-A123]|uniref:hypothetical protein n=1 Tax=Nonomuraea sp. NEAU-A123 TaxID=2839649 RepID=UPI001BE4DD19|nr:hypothetical protein [Nonomuraea sp. NEAU-A123]MBT2224995.1 hypothetical protein [Nonomuraea sp. NEAU-A123]
MTEPIGDAKTSQHCETSSYGRHRRDRDLRGGRADLPGDEWVGDGADGGALWVGSAEEPNGCVRTTNGTVGTRSYVGLSLTAAYRTGTWRLQRPDDPCRAAADRRGQNERMVPGEPVSVLVCSQATSASERPPRLESDGRTARALAETLNSLGTRPSRNSCVPIAGAADERFWLVPG